MTKRKASTALDPSNESNSSNLKIIATNSNAVTLGTCNSNSGNNTINSGVLSHANGSSINSSSMGKADNDKQQQETSNSQNDNSVESECVGNNGTTGNQHKSKKERADNWSSAEIQILHEGIESRRDVFYGPPSQATKKNRESAWEAITREVNSVSTTPRSLSQVMKKFKNEKCRAKRKFADPDKEGHISNDNNGSNNNLNCNNNSSNSNQTASNITTSTRNGANDATSSLNLTAQNQTTSNQQAQTTHHMTNSEPISAPQSSMNVVKLAPQNVAKTMIDLPGHVQHIQMPNDDMVLIVPPDMDSLLSGVNIVSDVNGHHHFQKCSNNGTINSHPHNQHHQHPLQTLNAGQTLVNGTMSNGMMTRAPFCILNQVECTSTGNDSSGAEHHIAQSVVNQTAFATNHLGINTQNLSHHRGTMIDQNQGQPTHHHQLHHHPQQQHQQQSQHQPHPSHTLTNSHNQHHLPQGHLATSNVVSNPGGVAIESQLKNLLFNLLLKDGQQASTVPLMQSSNQESKHRSDMLAVIASQLTKIEGHLSKIAKAATTMVTRNSNLVDNNERAGSTQVHNSSSSNLNISSSDGNNNNVDLSTTGSANRREEER